MSKPVSSLADVQSLAARCIEMADPQLDADFEAKFGLAPADFAALPAQAQQAHLQSHADAAKGAKYAVGNWGHLFGSDRHETNCRIVIDVENGELVAAQEKDGLKFVDLRGERFRDLAESVIEVNEAHNGYLDYGLVLSNELPGWAGGLDNAVSTLQGNVEKPTRGQFVAEVQRRYESGQDNVFEAYRSVYGEPNDDESDLEYVRRCAEQDYADSVYGGCIYQDVIDQWPLIAQGNVSNGQGNVAELAKYVADFESGVIASRGAINDASFDQKRLAASKEAIASGSDHDVKECLNWWAEAIASGSLVQGQGNVATSKDHPDAFFDAQGKLFDWETGDPMPQGWTGIAKRKDTLFVIGQDGEETSYTALYAKTMVDALKEAAARNLLGVQGNVEATTPIAATQADEHAALSAVASRNMHERMQTKELIGEPLDWAVARGLGRAYQARTEYDGIGMEYPPDRFSTDGGQGIEILEREGICINKVGEGVWRASYYQAKIKADGSGRSFMSAEGPTPLVAAMRSFCVARLGDCVDVPVDLISDIADVKKSVSKDDLPSPGM